MKAPAAVLAPLVTAGLLLAALSTAGCGYALVGRASNLPEDVRTVHVKALENRTQRSQVEQYLSNAIADELVTRQRLTVVGDEASADAELSGAVTAFAVTPVTFDNQGRATEYEISITAQMVFRRPGVEDGVLWSNDHYVFRQSYEVEVSETGYFDQEDVAIRDASTRFAETMVSDLLEGF